MFADDVDYTEIAYTQRSRLETVASHAGVAVAAPVLLWATNRFVSGIEFTWPAVIALYAALLINLAVVAWLAVRAVERGDSFEQTDRWDRPTTVVTLGVALALGAFAGGLAGPVPVLCLVFITYASGVFGGFFARFLGLFIAAAIVVVGVVTDTWQGEGAARGIGLCVLAVILSALTDLMTMSLLRAQEEAQVMRRVVESDVTAMSGAAEVVASGHLDVAMTDLPLEGAGKGCHVLGPLDPELLVVCVLDDDVDLGGQVTLRRRTHGLRQLPNLLDQLGLVPPTSFGRVVERPAGPPDEQEGRRQRDGQADKQRQRRRLSVRKGSAGDVLRHRGQRHEGRSQHQAGAVDQDGAEVDHADQHREPLRTLDPAGPAGGRDHRQRLCDAEARVPRVRPDEAVALIRGANSQDACRDGHSTRDTPDREQLRGRLLIGGMGPQQAEQDAERHQPDVEGDRLPHVAPGEQEGRPAGFASVDRLQHRVGARRGRRSSGHGHSTSRGVVESWGGQVHWWNIGSQGRWL